ncbi:MAG: hypothetical protein GY937_05550 [bacterium]|nr:hypothetical protein [bacterium]
MIFSIQNLFSDDQAITGDADSTNVIDLGVAGTPYGGAAALHQDIGKGAGVPILIQVTEAFNTLTSLTITISTGATTALGTSVASVTIALADLVVGAQVPIMVLPNGIVERYLGVEYAVTGTDPTTGKITAGITMGNQTNVTGA